MSLQRLGGLLKNYCGARLRHRLVLGILMHI